MIDVMVEVNGTNEKYVLAVFLDITGAFDNGWRPKIIVQLRDFGIVGKQIDVIKDYFRSRYALLRFSGVEQEKQLTMGCPKGSVVCSLDFSYLKGVNFLHMLMMT